MARKRKAVDLERLADAARDALVRLDDEGFADEVATLREFIEAQGDAFREAIRINRDVNSGLSRRTITLEKEMRRHGVPVPQA